MVLENDPKIVVDVLIRTSEAPIAIDNIIGEIRAKLQNFRYVEISMLSEMAIVQLTFWPRTWIFM